MEVTIRGQMKVTHLSAKLRKITETNVKCHCCQKFCSLKSCYKFSIVHILSTTVPLIVIWEKKMLVKWEGRSRCATEYWKWISNSLMSPKFSQQHTTLSSNPLYFAFIVEVCLHFKHVICFIESSLWFCYLTAFIKLYAVETIYLKHLQLIDAAWWLFMSSK